MDKEEKLHACVSRQAAAALLVHQSAAHLRVAIQPGGLQQLLGGGPGGAARLHVVQRAEVVAVRGQGQAAVADDGQAVAQEHAQVGQPAPLARLVQAGR